uniref:Uncharacterized protein n=1 Tax=viral metagenome TaxID=1070528 RepID=A0A6M3IHD4_9ZZZZ
MTLDPTARRTNIKDSIKKWAIDDIETVDRPVTFDKYLATPNVAGGAVHKWVSFNLGDIDRGYLSEIMLDICCCTRNDPEGFKLAQLTDNVMEQLSDTTETDGMKRIPFYRSYASQPWELLGALLIQDVKDSAEMEAPDGTKFVILSCRLRTASKV